MFILGNITNNSLLLQVWNTTECRLNDYSRQVISPKVAKKAPRAAAQCEHPSSMIICSRKIQISYLLVL